MNILRIYVAAVCLASIVFGLHDAPVFIRARQRAANAALLEKKLHGAFQKATDSRMNADVAATFTATVLVDASGNPYRNNDMERAALHDAEDTAKAGWTVAVAEKSTADDGYDLQRAYALLIGGVFVSHIVLLWIVARRAQSVTTPTAN